MLAGAFAAGLGEGDVGRGVDGTAVGDVGWEVGGDVGWVVGSLGVVGALLVADGADD